MRASELAQKAGIEHRSSASRALAKLEAQGLAQRHAQGWVKGTLDPVDSAEQSVRERVQAEREAWKRQHRTWHRRHAAARAAAKRRREMKRDADKELAAMMAQARADKRAYDGPGDGLLGQIEAPHDIAEMAAYARDLLGSGEDSEAAQVDSTELDALLVAMG